MQPDVQGILHSRKAAFRNTRKAPAGPKAEISETDAREIRRLETRLDEERDELLRDRQTAKASEDAYKEQRAALELLTNPPPPEPAAKGAKAPKKKSKAEIEEEERALEQQRSATEAAKADYAQHTERVRARKATIESLEERIDMITRTQELAAQTKHFAAQFATELQAARDALAVTDTARAAGHAEDGFVLENEEWGKHGTTTFHSAVLPQRTERVIKRTPPMPHWRSTMHAPPPSLPAGHDEASPFPTFKRNILTPNGQAFTPLVERNPNPGRPFARSRASSRGSTPALYRSEPIAIARTEHVDGGRTADVLVLTHPPHAGPKTPPNEAHDRRRAGGSAPAARPTTAGTVGSAGAKLAPAPPAAGAQGARPSTSSSLLADTAAHRRRAEMRAALSSLPFGHVDVAGDLPTFNVATYGPASRKANPPESLRDRLPWRPYTPPGVLLPQPRRSDGYRSGQDSLRAQRMRAGANSVEWLYEQQAAIAREQAACREQLRVDALKVRARDVLRVRSGELGSLRKRSQTEAARAACFEAEFSVLRDELQDLEDLVIRQDFMSTGGMLAEGGVDGMGSIGLMRENSRKGGLGGDSFKSTKSRPDSGKSVSSRLSDKSASAKGKAAPAAKAGSKAGSAKPSGGAKRAPSSAKLAKGKSSLKSSQVVEEKGPAELLEEREQELVSFAVGFYLPAAAAAEESTTKYAELDRDLDESRRDLAGVSRMRPSGFLK